MSELIYDCRGTPIPLGELLGRGGEGSVYALAGKSGLVVKLYENGLNEPQRSKILALADSGLKNFEKRTGTSVAWPQIMVYQKRPEGKLTPIGYAMKRIIGVPLKKLSHGKLCDKYFPKMNRMHMVEILLQIAKTLNAIHKQGFVVGDLNDMNILVQIENAELGAVHFIDSDSFQFGKYRCLVGRPEMTPPELHDRAYSEFNRSVESDTYGFAVLAFQLFMLGRHPFDVVGGESPTQNMRSGHFPWGKKGLKPGVDGSIPPGDWLWLWSHLQKKTRGLFIGTFSNPDQRPSLKEWIQALHEYKHALLKNWLDSSIKSAYTNSIKEAN